MCRLVTSPSVVGEESNSTVAVRRRRIFCRSVRFREFDTTIHHGVTAKAGLYCTAVFFVSAGSKTNRIYLESLPSRSAVISAQAIFTPCCMSSCSFPSGTWKNSTLPGCFSLGELSQRGVELKLAEEQVGVVGNSAGNVLESEDLDVTVCSLGDIEANSQE